MKTDYDVVVLGGGPAGLAAALAAKKEGASVLLAEREARLGGILKQCIHDGFGLVRFGKKLAGPEYAQYFIDKILQEDIDISLLTFATKIERTKKDIKITFVSRQGIRQVTAGSLVLATGCRERTAKQVGIHGSRPAGVLTAGAAQYYTNVLGQLPGRRCVILGSGDIGLIMARRLTLEGAKVLAVYEAKPTPSGLARNICQCLTDFEIPLFVSRTVTRVFGEERLCGVETAKVDEKMRPIPGTEQRVDCDTLILSVGLIPENELAEGLGIQLDAATKGPVCDQNFATGQAGVFVCGNAAQVNDLVDYVSETGEAAGAAAARFAKGKQPQPELAQIKAQGEIACVLPQRIDRAALTDPVTLYFRVRRELGKSRLSIWQGETQLMEKRYPALRPPEMERVLLKLSAGQTAAQLTVRVEEET